MKLSIFGGPYGRCFLAAWVVSKSVIGVKNGVNGRYPPIPMFSVGLLIGKRFFQDGAIPG